MKLARWLALIFALSCPVWAQEALTLEAALKALQNSPSWRSADLSYESALRALEAAQAASGLQVTPGASYTLADSGGSTSNNLTLSGTASLNVLPWTPSADAIRAAQRALERAALTRASTRNTLYATLISQYFGVRQAMESNSLAQANLKLQEALTRVAQAKYDTGQLSLSDLLTQQQALESAQVSAGSAVGNLEIARQTLANTLGIPASNLGEFPTAPTAPTLPTEPLEALISQAQARRPDVRIAQSQLEDAQDNLSIAQRNRWLPDSSVNLGYSVRNPTTGTTTTSISAGLDFKSGAAGLSASVPVVSSSSGSTANVLSLGLSVSFPLLAPSGDASIRSSQTALSAAQLALQSAQRAAELDVRQKYQQAQTALAQVGIAQAALTTANQTLKTAQAKLAAGTGTAVDVQQAQVNVQQAQVNLDSAIINAQTAAIALQNALGVNLTGANP
ncbi:TolC family protein [Meiothermus granaticius]|uniref:Outer membrane protein TolC n=1 Tax=Meiothermus granaticius NBRC 107808 TaxID=1227551 RepID=A0A399FCD5_9DEIN|nr:TolC family protein [Meiothermus granaticius]RIH92662.1 Outer membrane protein TolC [Meiothermus granaticius NBRC 107808]GEM87572.1 transporter [Meiothermus granaticius NBRC 107808]